MCEQYWVDHVNSSHYYLQGNGLADASKTLLRILSRTVYEEPKRWADFISILLWAYRPSKLTSTQAQPFFLVCEVESIVPIEVMVSSAHVALASKASGSHSSIQDVEALERIT